MTIADFWSRAARAPEDGAGAGSAGAAGAGGAADGGAGAGAGAGGDGGAGAGTGGGAKWWETDAFADTRDMLVAKGLTVDDPAVALARTAKLYHQAESRLGKPADSLIERPKKDQPLTEWMRQQRDVFGIPEKPEDYQLEAPKDLPKGVQWDGKLEARARAKAHELGMNGEQLKGMAGEFFAHMGEIAQGIETELQASTEKMMAELVRDWGDQLGARIERSKLAAQAIAAKAGLSPDAVQAMSMSLSAKIGDANTMKFIDAIADMMGDDVLKGAGAAGGATFGTTPAEARAQLAALRAPGGAYFEATAANDTTRMKELQPQIERLTRLAAG
jgi:hypothetical protein